MKDNNKGGDKVPNRRQHHGKNPYGPVKKGPVRIASPSPIPGLVGGLPVTKKGAGQAANAPIAKEAVASKMASQRLEDQPWYHGVLPRDEIKQHLQKEGQFLIRTSTKTKLLSIVISLRWDGKLQHFKIHRDAYGWKLEGAPFPTVAELVKHHMTNNIPVTQDSGALLKIPIKRNAWQLDHRDIIVETVLGAGQFGEVCAGRWYDPESPTQTAKRVAIKKCTRTGPMSDEEKKAFLNEAKLMLSYSHKNIVTIYGVACDKPPIMIVMELCEHGSLDKYLRKYHTILAEKLHMAIDTSRGMEYLATRPLPCVHRDLAARNCLVGANGEVKISDFGMSREGPYAMASLVGKIVPIRWTSPEALDKGIFNTMSDVYSYGVLLWEIYSNGKIPWTHLKGVKQVYKTVKTGTKMESPPDCPLEVYALMYDCWNLIPKMRPTFTGIRKRLEKMQNVTSNYAVTLHTSTYLKVQKGDKDEEGSDEISFSSKPLESNVDEEV